MTSEWEELREIQLDSACIYDGKIMHVVRDRVLLPNGHESVRELMRHVGAVCIVPVTDDGCVYVERQFRYPLNEVITEIPAGKLDSKEEDPLEAAKRELREETGLTAERWTDLGTLISAPAYSDERIHVYLAQGLKEGERKLDEDEFLNVQRRPFSELLEEVMNGTITDGKTQMALLKAARFLSI